MAFHGSPFDAEIVNGRIEGKGKYTFKDGKVYLGEFKDGQYDLAIGSNDRFHGAGTIHYTNGDRYEAQWQSGIAIQGKFTFKDGLDYQEQDWDYCTEKDRRFYSERVHGFRLGETQLSNQVSGPESIPKGTYDVGDGYYDALDHAVHDYKSGKSIRQPDQEEVDWITRYVFPEYLDHRRCRYGLA